METVRRYGSIVSLSGDIANIGIKHEAGCSEKHNGCPFKDNYVNPVKKDFVVTANNKINAKTGQFVEISISGKKLSGFAFLLFIFPLLMIFLCALIGYFLSNNPSNNSLFASIGGIFGFLTGLFIIRVIEKKYKNTYEITKIIS